MLVIIYLYLFVQHVILQVSVMERLNVTCVWMSVTVVTTCTTATTTTTMVIQEHKGPAVTVVSYLLTSELEDSVHTTPGTFTGSSLVNDWSLNPANKLLAIVGYFSL